jgi:hypothetical protein
VRRVDVPSQRRLLDLRLVLDLNCSSSAAVPGIKLSAELQQQCGSSRNRTIS